MNLFVCKKIVHAVRVFFHTLDKYPFLSKITDQEVDHPGTDSIFYTPEITITGTSSVTSPKEWKPIPSNVCL